MSWVCLSEIESRVREDLASNLEWTNSVRSLAVNIALLADGHSVQPHVLSLAILHVVA